MTWIDVNKELPTLYKDVLIWTEGNFYEGYYTKGPKNSYWTGRRTGIIQGVTHWMNIKPPK